MKLLNVLLSSEVSLETCPWLKGTPKRVNKLTHYYNSEYMIDPKTGDEIYKGKANMPKGHVRAAINYNRMRRMNSDKYSMEIMDGMKTIVCKLKVMQWALLVLVIPTDETPFAPNGTKNFLLIARKWNKELLQKRLKTYLV